MPNIHIAEVPVKNRTVFQLLSNVVQRTYGKQSETSSLTNQFTVPKHEFVNFKLADDKHLFVTYTTLVSINQKQPLAPLMKQFEKAAVETINQEIKKVQEQYKEEVEQQITTETIKPKITIKLVPGSLKSYVDYAQTTIYAHLKRGFYKLHATFEIVDE